MEYLISFLVTFFVVFIGRFAFYLFSKRKKKKSKKQNSISVEISYLIKKFNLNKKKIDKKFFALIFSAIDALIIGLTLLVVILITDKMVLQILLAFVVVIVLILAVYEIFGRILLWKGYDK